MAIALRTRPKINSPFIAAKNQATYVFIREDFVFTNYQDDGSNRIQVVIAGNVTSTFVVGASFFLFCGASTTVSNGDVTVHSSAFASGNTTIVFEEAPVTAAIGLNGKLNDNRLLNYYIEVELYEYTTNKLLFSALTISPIFDPTNNIIAASTVYAYVDVSNILQGLLDPNNTFMDECAQPFMNGYITRADTIAQAFYIKYREVWTGSSNAQTADSGTTGRVIGILGKFNVNQQNSYDTYLNGGKWLTKFTRPKLWIGFPFSLSMVIGAQAGTTRFTTVWKDAAGSILFTDNNSIAGVYSDYSLIRISPENIWITNHGGSAIPNTVATLEIYFTTNSINSPTLIIDVLDTSIMQNTLMMYWRDSLGGDAYFGFTYNQEKQLYFQAGTKNKRYNLFAENLTDNEWEAIQDCTTLGEVYKANILYWTNLINKLQKRTDQQIYITGLNGNYLSYGVLVVPTEGVTETKRRGHRMQLTIELPEQA